MREQPRPARAGRLVFALALLAPGAAAADVETRLYLIGDAGAPARGGEPALRALGEELSRDPGRSFVVFLGDNVYPRGLSAEGDAGRRESERRLRTQIETVRDTGARFLFVPGNHDWDQHGSDGWQAVKRQARYVLEHGGPGAGFEPRGGCPGPVPVPVGERLLLVALDTQWWLHDSPKPTTPADGCDVAGEAGVVDALAALLREAGEREVVVVAHHPLLSGGGHGGHFGWKEHIFPLRAWKGWLWLPLPLIGSAYPIARQNGVFAQDIGSGPYRHMVEALSAALQQTRPLAWAAGHDHNLQVLDGRSVRNVLVSGAGLRRQAKPPQRIEATRFRSGEPGFLRLDVARDGGVELTAITVDDAGRARERYAQTLASPQQADRKEGR